jgi:hypothetical protein
MYSPAVEIPEDLLTQLLPSELIESALKDKDEGNASTDLWRGFS